MPVFSQTGNPQETKFPNGKIYIPSSLEVAPFVPPIPMVPKAVPSIRKDAMVTIPMKNAKKMTIIRGEASDLPDIPVPLQQVQEAEHPESIEEIASATDARRHFIFLGATILDHRVSIVNWKHPDTNEQYEAVCGFDVSLLEGVGGFVSNDENYELCLVHALHEKINSSREIKKIYPNLPQVSEGSIIFLKGNQDDLKGTVFITLIKDLIGCEKGRLKVYQTARKEYQIATGYCRYRLGLRDVEG